MNKRQAKKRQHLEELMESTGLIYYKKRGIYKYIRKYDRWCHEKDVEYSRKPIICTPNYWGVF